MRLFLIAALAWLAALDSIWWVLSQEMLAEINLTSTSGKRISEILSRPISMESSLLRLPEQ